MKKVLLNSQNSALMELQKSIENKDKLVLLIGKTGLGKSFLLETLWEMEFKKAKQSPNEPSLFNEADLQNSENSQKSIILEQENSPKEQKIFLFSKPFFDENAFVSEIFESISNENYQKQDLNDSLKTQNSKNFTNQQNTQNFELLHAKFKSNAYINYIFLLDEVGMYEESLLEKLRILSDLPNVAFILALHKKQEILQKEHFKSRIFKEIWLKSLSANELNSYAKGKFQLVLKNRHLKRLLRVSGSNLRLVDKVLITFGALSEFYAKKKHSKSCKKMLEMSAFYHGLLK